VRNEGGKHGRKEGRNVSPQLLHASGDCSPWAVDPVWAGDTECPFEGRGDGVMVVCANDGWEESGSESVDASTNVRRGRGGGGGARDWSCAFRCVAFIHCSSSAIVSATLHACEAMLTGTGPTPLQMASGDF
jgi:hypothetical protein